MPSRCLVDWKCIVLHEIQSCYLEAYTKAEPAVQSC